MFKSVIISIGFMVTAVLIATGLATSASAQTLSGDYTIQQQSNGRYVDAYINENDNKVVTRTKQNNNTQVWILKSLKPTGPTGGGDYYMRQKANGNYVGAYQGTRDNDVVTRAAQGNPTQVWRFYRMGGDLFRIKQKSSDRYMDAHVGSKDHAVVTRDFQNNATQVWIVKKNVPPAPPPLQSVKLNGVYFLQQRSNSTFLDAWEGSNDNSAVTRPFQNNATQIWRVRPLGNNVFTIQQRSSGRYLDAHETGNDFSAVTRDPQQNDTQRWVFRRVNGNNYTIRQKVNGRYLEAYEAGRDNSAVTRPYSGSSKQQWILVPAQ